MKQVLLLDPCPIVQLDCFVILQLYVRLLYAVRVDMANLAADRDVGDPTLLDFRGLQKTVRIEPDLIVEKYYIFSRQPLLDILF